MKTLIVFLLAVWPLVALGQDSHVVSQHRSYGGFGGPATRFTELNGQFGVVAGGHGGWVLNHTLAIGAGGYAVMGSGIDLTGSFPAGSQPWLSLTYGGLEVQYLDRSQYRTHLVLFGLAAAGKAVSHLGTTTQDDGVFVAEPGIIVTRHISRTIHLEIGATYRFVSGVTLPGTSNSGLSGFSGLIGLDFGHF